MAGLACEDEAPAEITGTEEPTEEVDVEKREYYLTILEQLQNYLHGSVSYSPDVLRDLDMDFNGTLDVFDLALLKRLYAEEMGQNDS
ncbi:MAG: hypothetical protein IKI21_00425 [Oscillospiraceae bacterium]|nr:hypothetical protein [Oscillospiraceae bacterium]